MEPTDERRLVEPFGGVRQDIIGPDEAAQFKFSLHGESTTSAHDSGRHFIRHSTKKLDSEVDWTNASDFEFRRMQESKIRDHYGLDQRSLHSSQAPLDLPGPRVTGARYNLYDSATVAEPIDWHRHPRGSQTDRQLSGNQHRFNSTRQEIIEDHELEERTLQNFSLYENTRSGQNKGAYGRAGFYGDSNHGASHEDIGPWVSESSVRQRDRRYGKYF
jgi:hypothetical protein